MAYLLALLLCLWLYITPDIYQQQWVVMTALACAGATPFFFRRFRAPLAVLCLYLLSTNLLSAGNVYDKLTTAAALMSARHTAMALLMVVLLPRLPLSSIARAVGPVWAILTLCGIQPLWNYSCNAAFLVCLVPFQRHWLTGLFLLLPSAFQMGTTPLFIAGVLGAYYAVTRRLWWSVAALPAFGWWAYLNPWRFDEHERWQFYVAAIRYWWQHTNIWLGTGYGSFPMIGPTLQFRSGLPVKELWLSAHSDFVQILVETGLVGFALFAWVATDTFIRLDERHRMSFLGCVAFGVFYFPMAIPFVLAWIVGLVLVAQSSVGRST